MAWYNYPVTQPFGLPYEPEYGGHSGIDLGTPDNTPLFLPVDGKVVEADYQPWGGQIAVLTDEGMMVFLHANNIDVRQGQTYHAGEVLGTSGGGVGDKLLNPTTKQVYTATSQSNFAGYSSGYHTHFAVFNVTDYNGIQASLGQNINRVNPASILAAFIGGKQLTPTGGTTTLSDTSGGGIDFHSIGVKLGIFALALIAVILGFYILFQKQVNSAVGTGIKDAAKAAVLV